MVVNEIRVQLLRFIRESGCADVLDPGVCVFDIRERVLEVNARRFHHLIETWLSHVIVPGFLDPELQLQLLLYFHLFLRNARRLLTSPQLV